MVSITLASITKALKKSYGDKVTPSQLKRDAEKRYREVEKLRKQPKAKEAILTVTFPRNRTWGNNSAKAVIEGRYVDETPFKFSYTASGAGYDKESKAIGRVLDLAAASNLLAKKTVPRRVWHNPDGYSIPRYEGGWSGWEFKYMTPSDIGILVEPIVYKEKQRVYKLKWK